MLNALDRKMLRDLFKIRTQALAISAVIAAGIATLVMSLSTRDSIQWSMDAFYEQYSFSDVFAHLKRAPNALAKSIEAIPGVAQVETRINFDVTLDISDMDEPATGRLISIPDVGKPRQNGLYLRRGRWLEPYQRNEVLIGEAFAQSHGLSPGDQVVAIINGRKQRLKIAGVVLSPEYLIQVGSGSLLPDDERFGVFYMGYEGLAAALNMEQAFNNVTLKLKRGATEADVLQKLDNLIEPYGGVGSYGRSEQISHQYVSDEVRQLKAMSLTAPVIFLSVAAFLLNVVITRLINTQREQIAALKAFGYSKSEIAWHYLKLIAIIPIVGTIVGTGFGAWMGHGLATIYARFYRFPVFDFQLDLGDVAIGIGVSCLAAFVGTLAAVRRAVSLSPAEAMRPEPPPNYRPTLVERIGLGRFLSQTLRMILRSLERKPVKALFSILGIATAVAVLILGSFGLDAIRYIMDFQFRIAQRQTLTVTFVEPTSRGAIYELENMPGVIRAQAFRSVPTRLRHGHRHKRTAVMGIGDHSLFRLMDDQERQVDVPPSGLLLSDKLAERLDAAPGDTVTMEILEGSREIRQVPVTGIITEFSGTNAYMHIDFLRRTLREGTASSGAHLQVDQLYLEELYQDLKLTPRVAGVGIKDAMIQSFEETIAENILRMRLFNIIFATVIAFGVVYNTARISLSERGRELSTLRVIGFTRGEISGILLGELAILTLVAIPFGLFMGYGFAAYMTLNLDTDLYRIPLIIELKTFANAAIIVTIATIISALIVRRRIDRLDLVAVLKSKE